MTTGQLQSIAVKADHTTHIRIADADGAELELTGFEIVKGQLSLLVNSRRPPPDQAPPPAPPAAGTLSGFVPGDYHRGSGA